MFSGTLYGQYEVVIDISGPGPYDIRADFCAALNSNEDIICITTSGTKRDFITATLVDFDAICPGGLTIEDKKIKLPNLFNLEIEESIILTGNSELEGSSPGGTNIFIKSDNTTGIILDACDNCEVKNLRLEGKADNTTGIDISSDGSNIANVGMLALEYGVIIKSNGNLLSDLILDDVAADDGCDANLDDGVGIWLVGDRYRASGNVLQNAVHTGSAGGITIRIDDYCKNNLMENISVEGENATQCSGNTPFGDPSVFLNVSASNLVTGNIILVNLNGGGIRGIDQWPSVCNYCVNNTLNFLEDFPISFFNSSPIEDSKCPDVVYTGCENSGESICR